MNSQSQSKQALRKFFRAQRRALSQADLEHTALKVAERIQAIPEYQQAQRIGVYSATPEEISLNVFITQARIDQKRLYLPVIDKRTSNSRMSFHLWLADDKLTSNRHGIPEPAPNSLEKSALALDLILVPLVAFDKQGHRLGMGGGFYDRYFDNTQHNESKQSLRIGIAHSSQCSATLPSDKWDVDCHAIATEKELIKLY